MLDTQDLPLTRAAAESLRRISKVTCLFLSLIGLTLAAARGQADTKPASWQTLARCAAAYRANAQILDPSRPHGMKMQMMDVAKDYETAAEAAFQRTRNVPASRSHDAIFAYVTKRTEAFAKQSRTQIEHFMDSCPQPSN
jgi:hypothetical protein